MFKPDLIKASPAENYDDLKRQFFALKKLCESKINQCSVYSKKLAEYDHETLIARNEALESEREMNAQLTAELEKANERVKELKADILNAIGAIEREDDESLYDANCILSSALSQLRKEQE